MFETGSSYNGDVYRESTFCKPIVNFAIMLGKLQTTTQENKKLKRIDDCTCDTPLPSESSSSEKLFFFVLAMFSI